MARQVKPLPPSKRQYVRTFPALLLAREIPNAKPAPFPGFIDPCLATLHQRSPTGSGWVHEIKYDGYRVQMHVRQGKVQLFTRRGHDWTDRFENVALAAWDLKTYAAVVDGEVIVPTPEGHSDFHALEQDLGAGRSDRFVFYAFDLLHLDGLDLRSATLLDRKQVLAELLADAAEPIRYSEHVEADGTVVYENACQLELEGVVSKRINGRYQSGRSHEWFKATCRHRDTFAIAGWAEKNGKFDGVYLSRNDEGELAYGGKLERGFDEADTRHLLALLEPLRTKTPPFDAPRRFPKARWVKPTVLIDAEFRGRTGDGLLRHPSYKGIREDLMDAPGPRRVRRASGRRGRPGLSPRRS
jgi:bifunctional non-homologous end joining protein LigD